MDEEKDRCSICLEDLEPETEQELTAQLLGKTGKTQVCTHTFHVDCIRLWSESANNEQRRGNRYSTHHPPKCPLCKHDFFRIRSLAGQELQVFKGREEVGRKKRGRGGRRDQQVPEQVPEEQQPDEGEDEEGEDAMHSENSEDSEDEDGNEDEDNYDFDDDFLVADGEGKLGVITLYS